MEIDKGRLNGIVGLGTFLKRLDEEDVAYELASFRGGTAGNAIPPQAEADIVISTGDQDRIRQMLAAYCEELNEQYKGIEADIQCEATEIDGIPKVISGKDKGSEIRLIAETITGIHTMSKDMEGLVESSANLAIFTMEPEGATVLISVRSSDPGQREKILDAQKKLARECGFETTIDSFADAWKYDPDSMLMELAKKVYREQNGEEISVVAAHAGLGCGTFKKKNPDLDMISIGPDVKDVHTPKETVYLNSVPRVWRLLEGILAEVSAAETAE